MIRVAAVAALVTFALAAGAGAAPTPSRDPQQRHTAADMKRAGALALRRTDLAAGWKTDKPQKPSPPCTAGPDESKLVQTARIDPSFTWKDGVTNVGSEVDIFRSAPEALQDWRLSKLDLSSTCLLPSPRAGVGAGVQGALLSATKPPAPGAGPPPLHIRLVSLSAP